MKTSRIQLRRFILENIGKILEAETGSDVTGRERGMSVSPHPLPGMTGLAVGDTVYLERDAYMDAEIWAFGQDFPPVRVVELGNIEDLVGTTVPGDPAPPGQWEWVAGATGPGFVGAYEPSPGLDEEQLVFPVSAIDWGYTESGPKEPWEMPEGPGMFAGGPSEDDYVTLTTSDDAVRPGEEIRLHWNMSGIDTGWAVIANPYYRYPPGHDLHDPDWRGKDGDTVIGVEEGTPGARPVADMYQIFRDDEEQERKEREAWFAQAQTEYEAEEADDPHEWMEDRFHQEQEGGESDIEDERRDAQRAYDDAREAELAVAAAEKERMKTPEEGEEMPKRTGMGRRPRQGAARYARRGQRISEAKSLGALDLRDVILETLVEAIDQDKWREFYKPSYEAVAEAGWVVRGDGGGEALSKRLRGDDNPYTLGDESSGITADEILATAIDDKLEDKYDPTSDEAIFGESLEDWKLNLIDALAGRGIQHALDIEYPEDLPDTPDYDYEHLFNTGTDPEKVALDMYADYVSAREEEAQDRLYPV